MSWRQQEKPHHASPPDGDLRVLLWARAVSGGPKKEVVLVLVPQAASGHPPGSERARNWKQRTCGFRGPNPGAEDSVAGRVGRGRELRESPEWIKRPTGLGMFWKSRFSRNWLWQSQS